ncbi:MAG: hypothetical protein K6G42_06510 [Lachnospiraceae bacterium]|nr:hypothetical protein [Lachnospiraceae bacterium]
MENDRKADSIRRTANEYKRLELPEEGLDKLHLLILKADAQDFREDKPLRMAEIREEWRDPEDQKLIERFYDLCFRDDGTLDRELQSALLGAALRSKEDDGEARRELINAIIDGIGLAENAYEEYQAAGGDPRSYIESKREESRFVFVDELKFNPPKPLSEPVKAFRDELRAILAALDQEEERARIEQEEEDEFLLSGVLGKWKLTSEEALIFLHAGKGLSEGHPYLQLLEQFKAGNTGSYDPISLENRMTVTLPLNELLRKMKEALKDAPDSQDRQELLTFIHGKTETEEGLRREEEAKTILPKFPLKNQMTGERYRNLTVAYRAVKEVGYLPTRG